MSPKAFVATLVRAHLPPASPLSLSYLALLIDKVDAYDVLGMPN